MKKHIITALCGVVLLGGSSCNLDFKPVSEITYVGFWEKEEAARAGFTGVVSQFRAHASTFYGMGEIRADGWLGSKTMESTHNDVMKRNQYSETIAPYANWAGFYGLIHYINDFLANAEKAQFQTPTDRDNMMAQVYGMRAFVYYTMLKAWGDVIITTEPLTGDKVSDLQALRRKRSPKAEVMALVLSDIEKSLEYYNKPGVKPNWQNSSVYWSKAATLTLKGDALLWKGEVLTGGEADFREAKNALQAVVDLSKYSLVPYEQLWGTANEGNREFIFAFDYQKDQAQHFYSGNYAARSVDLRDRFSQNQENLFAMGFSGGNREAPSDELLHLLYAQADKRQATFALIFDTRTPQDLTTLSNSSNPHYKGAILRKFWGQLEGDGTRLKDENVPLYRYADVLLLLAEAKNQLGEDPSSEINQVRTRAGVATMYANGSKIDNKRAILEERFKEFVGEGKRWWDLVRAGDGLVFEYVKSIPANEAFRIYYPISSGMISVDPEYITQTEGY